MWYRNYSCGDCVHCDLNERNRYDNSKAYCSERREYVVINSTACERYFLFDEGRKNSTGGGCYLTTIMVNILGFDDNNIFLNEMREFRDKTLLENPTYLPLLWEYDTVGPVISECIKNDPKREAIAETYFLNYIQPICEMLKTGKPLTAIEKYKEMVNELKVSYNIHDVEYDENEKVTGKGYLLKR